MWSHRCLSTTTNPIAAHNSYTQNNKYLAIVKKKSYLENGNGFSSRENHYEQFFTVRVSR